MSLKAIESYDPSTNKFRRRYCLDNQRLCFLSVFSIKQKEIESISFDVEAADDYHYHIKADQLPKLCQALSCSISETDIVAAFIEQLKAWDDPIKIASLLKNAEVECQVHYWY